ncbi:MAG TPA: tripartite tricarboxylate transporter substrate-binding protein [Xanthobacteraceae bacterium]|nr:tripartite tricarboxylate transporter substrate-binding protein [Xanthobacteraceae bacterium]
MVRAIAALVVVLACAGPAHAQDWPNRTVTMVVPFPAGGPLDVVARIMAPPMSELLGQQVIIENIGGAGGSTGSSRVAKAAPDGYVFLYGNQGTHTFSQLLTKKPLYSAADDFTPVTMFLENSKVLVTRKDFPAQTLPEFIAYAKANQPKMSFGSAGGGSATHITCVLLNAAIGIDITHIPYRGTAAAMQDMMGGRIDYICDVISTALPLISSQSIKPLALLSPQRSKVLPELATADEQGLRGFDADAWNAFFLPRGTPEPIVRRLAKATSDALDIAWVRERLEGLGLNVPPPARRTPDYLAKLIPSELEKWAAPVKASGAATD